MKYKLALVSVVVITCLLFSFGSLVGEDAQQQLSKEFAGKLVLVYLRDNRDNSFVLENAELRQVGGRTMLVGAAFDSGDENDWTAGLRVGIAWDSVNAYYTMTKEQFKKADAVRDRILNANNR